MKFSIHTLGCKVNQSESDLIEANLKRAGWSVSDLSEQPDYSIINTCTVTAKSDYQSRQLIRRALRAGSKVIVTGCYSQLRPEEIMAIDKNIEIVDSKNKLKIANMFLKNNEISKTNISDNRSRPYLKVQDGCNFSCSYCTVPSARGKSRSIEISEATKIAEEIDASGYKEIVLTGIHLGSYGHDLNPKTNLSKLLKSLLKNTKIPRFRLSSLEISEIDSELIELLKEERICKHLHLPLQSGDNSILRRMNRMYSVEDYLSVVEFIIKNIPDISIGTDIIVGFPGEGEREFKNTKDLIELIPLTYLHIFPFSKRPNTLASKMPEQITFSIKKKRVNELKNLNYKKKIAYMKSHIGKILDIIVEQKDMNKTTIGTSANYLKVKTVLNSYPVASLIRIRISNIEKDYLVGDPVEKL
ncbi:MAG: tRNA (N(6)-L-threonylcarbamoyladenosine(37)-C(2))-methylthiotransferase MtaB [Nitrospirae bacterium]|nr:tRNA (N(6)-L-threonylcarbamoyladenosine(37)-C(2))-methylthiotransferase MtaB [Nitrospirota bacterium]